jgi:hypothetical protein
MPLGGERLSSSGIELWSTKVFQSFIAFSYQKGHVLRVPLLVCGLLFDCRQFEIPSSLASADRREIHVEQWIWRRWRWDALCWRKDRIDFDPTPVRSRSLESPAADAEWAHACISFRIWSSSLLAFLGGPR